MLMTWRYSPARIVVARVGRVLAVTSCILFILTGTGCAKQADPPPAAPVAPDGSAAVVAVSVVGPRIEGVHDLGYVKRKAERTVVFELTNATGSDLVVKRVRSECECMEAVEPPKVLLAGEPARFTVKLVAPDESQFYSERIIVQTDDPKLGLIGLRITAAIGRPLEIRPAKLDLGPIPAGSEREAHVTLVNHGDEPVALIYATASTPDCTARIARIEIPPKGGQVAVPVIVKPSVASGERQKQRITIHTGCPGQSQVRVPIEYSVTRPTAGTGGTEGD